MADINYSLVNFNAFSDIGNNLLNKLSEAIGWGATHDTPKRVAINTYIEDIKNSDRDPLEKAALISNAKRTIKEYVNQHNIIA